MPYSVSVGTWVLPPRFVEPRPDERHRLGEFVERDATEIAGGVSQRRRGAVLCRLHNDAPRCLSALERNQRDLGGAIPALLHGMIVTLVFAVLRAVATVERAVQLRPNQIRVPSDDFDRFP